MTTLENKQILFSGTGNMGQPALVGLLERADVNPDNVTIICGTNAKDNCKAIKALLAKKGIEIKDENLIQHDQLDIESLKRTKFDIVALGVKPQVLGKLLPQYDPLITDETILLSMAAGTKIQNYKDAVSANPKIARIMPHTPKAVYALYSEDQEARETAELVFSGMGSAVPLSAESDMPAFTAIAGSGPAFIAQFVSSFKEDMQKTALHWLKNCAAGKSSRGIFTSVDQYAAGRCMTFYNHYLATAKHYLGDTLGQEILDKTLAGTAEDLENTKLSLADYIAEVRSPKGTTNAGLIFMGNSPPQIPKFGNEAQLKAQNELAAKYKSSVEPEYGISYAVVAALHRSRGIAENVENPLHGVDEQAITEESKAITAGLSNGQML